jgi:hypothetical protein
VRRVAIGALVAAAVEGVSVDGAGVGGFYLDAPAAASVIDDEIVAVTFSPGLGDAESHGRGLVKEGGFGDFSAALGGHGWWRMRFVDEGAFWFHGCPCVDSESIS